MKQKNDLRIDRIGIMPIGALSVAFVSYIQGIDTFIESRKTHFKIGDRLKIYLKDNIKEIILTEDNYTDNIISLAIDGRLPEVILFSPPNHRLIKVLDNVLEMIGVVIELTDGCYIDKRIPKFVMLSNGIYYDDIINYITKHFENDTEERTIEDIKGNFIRATTLQTGLRVENEGGGFIFKPGIKSSITIAGGSKESREKIISLFNRYNYPVLEMQDVKRIEFDKAIINLSTNAVQLSLLFDENGEIRYLTMEDLISDQKMQEMCKRIIYTMTSIGVKSGIYKKDFFKVEDKELQKQLIDTISQEIWDKIEKKIDNNHILSSIATVIERFKKDKIEGKHLRLPPLEENIINYLLSLSRENNENNLEEERLIIEELRDSLIKNCEKLWC